MRDRDAIAVRVLRTTIAAIDNAEAPALEPTDLAGVALERSPRGVGAREVARLEMTADELSALVQHEVDDRLDAAIGYERTGEVQRATELRTEASILVELLAGHTCQ